MAAQWNGGMMNGEVYVDQSQVEAQLILRFTAAQLKEMCRSYRLPLSGNKSCLAKNLARSLASRNEGIPVTPPVITTTPKKRNANSKLHNVAKNKKSGRKRNKGYDSGKWILPPSCHIDTQKHPPSKKKKLVFQAVDSSTLENLGVGEPVQIPESSPIHQHFRVFYRTHVNQHTANHIFAFLAYHPFEITFVDHPELFQYDRSLLFLRDPGCTIANCPSDAETFAWPPEDNNPMLSWIAQNIDLYKHLNIRFPNQHFDGIHTAGRICEKGHITVNIAEFNQIDEFEI